MASDDPGLLQQAAEDLKDILSHFLGKKFSSVAISAIEENIKRHRQHCKDQGIDFPPLVALVLPSIQRIRLHPQELPDDNIERIIVNTCREFPQLSMKELAEAVHYAWPSYKPRGPAEARLRGGMN